jgi:hypothetical protein
MTKFSLLKNVQVMRILLSEVSGFRQLLLPSVAALCIGSSGCTSVTGSGASLEGFGFASDTTAILFYGLWETTHKSNIPVNSSSTNYNGWELKLVDVRFHKVYWSSRIDYSRSNSQILESHQWNDSTMLVALSDEYWLWTIGDKKPQKINFNWNTEMKNYRAGNLFRLRPWKEGSVLLFPYFGQAAIADSKTMIVNGWSPADEDAWVTSCSNFWWEKEIGWMCLMRDRESCSLSLLLENGATSSNVTYAHGCSNIFFESIFFYRYFIEADIGRCNPSVAECPNYPAIVEKGESSSVMFQYNKNGNIIQDPSFWIYYGEERRYLKFADSLGNFARY